MEGDADESKFRSHLTLALITLLHMFTHAYGTILVPLYLPMRDGLQLNGVGAVSLIVSIYTLVYCLFSVLAGMLADHSNRKVLLGIGLVVNAAAILLMGMTRRYEVLVMLGVLAGLAGTLFHPAANALSTAHYPKSPGMAIGILSIGAAIGFFAGPRYAGWRAQTAGWQTPLIEAGIVGVVFGVLFLLLAKEIRQRVVATPASPRATGVGATRGDGTVDATTRGDGTVDAATRGDGTVDVATRGDAGVATTGDANGDAVPVRVPLPPGLRWRMVGVALTIGARDFAGLASLTLTSIYLQKAHGYSVAKAGLVIGSMMLVAIVANPLAVYFSPGKRRLWTLLGILLGGAAVIATIPFVSTTYVLPVLCIFQACHLGSYAVAEAAILERVAPAVRGRVIGIFITVAGTLASLAPWLMGAWTDTMKERAYVASSYALPFGVLALLFVYASTSILFIRRLGETPEHGRAFEPMIEINPATLEVSG
jgi:MFS family permease